ncbi:hypothetical protein RN001_009440 [Aquatica leii]|uniref:Arf-GAP with Rho-GAP domain, ANK repeat and PH domain-containing protein 1 n=1 Tax=Aquatica leii TaxID=1421715 RepID=A0AAN7PTS2_9COLE|nr:hypothetical protein RN001_009440 [Aquatica leii]
MSAPVPAPRTLHNENKKPVPTPRKLIPIVSEQPLETNKEITKDWEPNFNTFSRRVRTLSNTSKQITEEIAGMVQEKKKAVLEGTRESVRKIKRRFTTAYSQTAPPEVVEDDRRSESALTNIFNSISFQSPIPSDNENQSIYSNVEIITEYDSSEESISLPPPLHPPPPLREDSIYDQPQSLASGSTNSNSNSSENAPILPHNPGNYESVFPLYPYNSDTDSCLDLTAGTLDNHASLIRSESFNYYDPVAKTENIYNNVDSTPVLQAVPTELKSENDDISETSTHIDIRNTLYENHTVRPPPRTKKLNKRPTESVIVQFDPLTEVNTSNYTNLNDLRALEVLLQGDLYGTISNVGTVDNWSSSESEVEEFLNPPTPPTRFDSLSEESLNVSEKTKSTWFHTDGTNTKAATSNNNEFKAISWFKQVNEVLKKAPEIVKGNKQKSNVLMRPMLSMKVVPQKGMLYKITSGPVEDLFGEFTSRWCILENANFICYADAWTTNIKENFSMDTILSVQALVDQKYKYNYDELHCFQINVTGKSRGRHVYGSTSISERRVWMQRLAECLYSKFPAKVTSDYSRIGWAYIKEGVSGEWIGAWLVLSKRTLHYAVDQGSPKSIDLCKARYIVLQNHQASEVVPRTNDHGPNLLIDCASGVIHLRMWTTRETTTWCYIIRLAAHNNGALLEEQQLTKNDIPVIVEKCINFIYAYGSMTEGIYRKTGVSSTVLDVLTQFRRDAYAVQLTLDKYSEHDVATALKRFFRDLPEPLLTSSNRQYLYQVSLVKEADEKIRMFRGLFDNFPPIAYKTIRRLLNHLHFISTQSKRNLMTADNLATVWGPTLMCCDEKDESLNRHSKEFAVVSQLISLYRNIFPENPEEMEQERMMLLVLEKCLKSPHGPVITKASGDLRVWVYLYNREGQTFHIAIGPQKTAYEVCLELSANAKLGVHELQLEEHVLNDNLIRPIHHTEKVLDVVLRWGYWDEPDRKDNALVLSSISKYWEYIQEKPLPVSGELKYADCKSKAFKLYMFEFAQAKLSYYKDKTCSTKLGSWNIEDILWYIGHEPKRNPQSTWTITFISKTQPPKRTKSTPWFGNIIAWSNPGLRASWLASMLKAEHPTDLMPPPQHVNLMSN